MLIEKEPERFQRAALRWHGRYCREYRDVDLDEGQAVLATLGARRPAEVQRGPRAGGVAQSAWTRARLRGTCRLGEGQG
jgi:hypothetical protein